MEGASAPAHAPGEAANSLSSCLARRRCWRPMPKPSILVVDDRENMLHLIDKVLRGDAIIRTASSDAEAVQILETRRVAAVVCDLRMPDMSGIDVLRISKRLQPAAEFVLM